MSGCLPLHPIVSSSQDKLLPRNIVSLLTMIACRRHCLRSRSETMSMGCKGRHPDILCINYKKEGGGFQCDALGSDGYSYTFFFRNQPAPQSYLDQYLCPLHANVMALLDQVVSKNHTIGMDNIYISAKFVIFGWRHPDSFMFHGVAREKGKGVEIVHTNGMVLAHDLI